MQTRLQSEDEDCRSRDCDCGSWSPLSTRTHRCTLFRDTGL